VLPQPSVGATENLLLATVLATGWTVIRNAAREPEIANLGRCLMAMGAWVASLDGNVLTVQGGSLLTSAVHTVMPDPNSARLPALRL
jgi:UDP-N-acetylglucosamine 1-carboxyvinyltransferase